MMCIVHLENGEIKGWIIGTDTHDLRRRALDQNIANILYRIEFPQPGKHNLGNGYWLLVS